MAITTRIRLQDVIMDAVVDENPTMPAEVTNKPVEIGEDISDHMKQQPFTLQLSGFMVDDAAGKLETLRSYQRESTLLTYTGRNIFTNMVLTNLDTRHSVTNAKGFDYTITLQHVKIAKPETFELNVKNPDKGTKDGKTATKVKAKSNAGRQQIKTTARNQVKNFADHMQDKKLPAISPNLESRSLSETLRSGLGENFGRRTNRSKHKQSVSINGVRYEVF